MHSIKMILCLSSKPDVKTSVHFLWLKQMFPDKMIMITRGKQTDLILFVQLQVVC